jgi:serine protease Do
MRLHTRRSALTLCLALGFSCVGLADDAKKVVTWNIARTTAPNTLDEANALQAQVKKIVERVTPATVALIMGGGKDDDEEARGRQQVGAGSGVIVSADGLILTAAHVVEPPVFGPPGRRRDDTPAETTVRVILPGDIRVKAKILGRNPRIDSGMVKIIDPVPEKANWPGAKDGKWPFVELGDSTKLSKGQWVVSLGHPGGPKYERRAPVRLGQMVRAGAKDRSIVSDCTLVGGDSGGPLFDLNGKLMGIHSRIGLSIEDNIHVPTSAYQAEWDKLVAGDIIGAPPRGGRPVLGIVLNRDEKDKEARITEFTDGSPSEKAGLKVGDVILKFEGKAVKTSDDIDTFMSDQKPGDVVKLEIKRGDETLEFEVKLGRRMR